MELGMFFVWRVTRYGAPIGAGETLTKTPRDKVRDKVGDKVRPDSTRYLVGYMRSDYENENEDEDES
jgi:hypothetical protein